MAKRDQLKQVKSLLMQADQDHGEARNMHDAVSEKGWSVPDSNFGDNQKKRQKNVREAINILADYLKSSDTLEDKDGNKLRDLPNGVPSEVQESIPQKP